MLEKFSAMQNSGDLNRSPDSVRQNLKKLPLEHYNHKVTEQKRQQKIHEKIEEEEHQRADLDLKNKLSILDLTTNFDEDKHIDNISSEIAENLSMADKIKNFKEELTKQGKSQTEILSLLIVKFENEEAVSTWVDNWRNFQKLHRFAESKPPAEQKAIQRIISNADFTSKAAFETSLTQISKSTEISQETKFEVLKQFGGSNIDSVDGMDYQLKQVKEHTKAIEQEIDNKSLEKESLDSEIKDLENQLDILALDDPKRQELEEKIEQKKDELEDTENEIEHLESNKPKSTSFELRKGVLAKLNPDGSRSITVGDNFAIKMPSHRLPFTTARNLRAINLAFPFKILRDLHLADVIFSPNLESGSVPTKSQRDMGHFILNALDIDDSKILSEPKIKQLQKDLLFLKPKGGQSPRDYLIGLGVYDMKSQSLKAKKLSDLLEK